MGLGRRGSRRRPIAGGADPTDQTPQRVAQDPARALICLARLVAHRRTRNDLARRDDEPTHARLSPALKICSAAVVCVVAAVDLGWTARCLS